MLETKEWTIIISLHLGTIGACLTMFWKMWDYINKKGTGVSKEDFDECKSSCGVRQNDFDELKKDFKHHKDNVQYKANCEEIQKRICADVENNRELLEQKLHSVQEVICAKIDAVNGNN